MRASKDHLTKFRILGSFKYASLRPNAKYVKDKEISPIQKKSACKSYYNVPIFRNLCNMQSSGGRSISS